MEDAVAHDNRVQLKWGWNQFTMKCRIFCAVLLSAIIPFGHSWDLRSIGIDRFRVRHVSLYHSRAFLTIESSNGE
uniref:Uncharacterized protein n=1 Tax=Anopheles minimus TaxID=112268 RepID=A0A182W2B6_9DIPT